MNVYTVYKYQKYWELTPFSFLIGATFAGGSLNTGISGVTSHSRLHFWPSIRDCSIRDCSARKFPAHITDFSKKFQGNADCTLPIANILFNTDCVPKASSGGFEVLQLSTQTGLGILPPNSLPMYRLEKGLKKKVDPTVFKPGWPRGVQNGGGCPESISSL